MLKKHFLGFLRWGLRLHGISHFIEVFSAIHEEAYVTASIATFFIFLEILASFYIIKEDGDLKPIKSDVANFDPILSLVSSNKISIFFSLQ